MRQLFHMDAYRLESIPEAEELDIDSMLANGPLLIEWADRVKELIPKDHMWVELEYLTEEHRQMRFKSRGRRHDALLEALRQSMFGGRMLGDRHFTAQMACCLRRRTDIRDRSDQPAPTVSGPSVQELRAAAAVDASGPGVRFGPCSPACVTGVCQGPSGTPPAVDRYLTLDVVAASRQPHATGGSPQAGRGMGNRLAGQLEAAGGPGPAKVETAESLANSIRHPTIVCGELHAEERRRLRRKRVNVVLSSAANSVRRPALLAELAWSRWQAGSVDDPAGLAPIYLHSAEPVPG
jgi:hypothetical protein